MTTKAKMSNLESYQELSIQIATLSMKVDKLLELAMQDKNQDCFSGPISEEDEHYLEWFSQHHKGDAYTPYIKIPINRDEEV